MLTYSGARKINASLNGFDGDISAALAGQLDLQKSYAVRSSASLEDTQDASFAGQFITVTSVHGLDALQTSIRAVLGSGQSASLAPYLQRLGESGDELQMAVLIQEMVRPVLSGVAFSKNPITGLDEIVIECVPGLGEALMQEGVTPQRWIYRWGQFTARPEEDQEVEPIIRGSNTDPGRRMLPR